MQWQGVFLFLNQTLLVHNNSSQMYMPSFDRASKRDELNEQQREDEAEVEIRYVDRVPLGNNVNNILRFYQGRNKPVIYLPAYVRIKVLGISQIEYVEMSTVLNVQIRIKISYEHLPLFWKNLILKKGIRLCFEKDDSILLKRDQTAAEIYDEESERNLQFVVRRFVNAQMSSDDLYRTPFETISSKVRLSLSKVVLSIEDALEFYESKNNQSLGKEQKQQIYRNYQGGVPQVSFLGDVLNLKEKHQKNKKDGIDNNIKSVEFHFNMMDHQDKAYKITTSDNKNFGLFEIASNQLSAIYSKNKVLSKNERQTNTDQESTDPQKQKILEPQLKELDVYEAYRFGHFDVKLFKKPYVALTTIFLPMGLLGILNLGIFAQDNDLHKRILSIGALMVSFVALIPTIRQQIPNTPKITIVQVLVFCQSFTTILALIDSLQIQKQQEGYNHKAVFSVSFFLVSFIITILVYVIILGQLIHYLHKRRYSITMFRRCISETKVKNEKNDTKNNYKIVRRSEWANNECQKYFQSAIKNKNVVVVRSSKDLILPDWKTKSVKSLIQNIRSMGMGILRVGKLETNAKKDEQWENARKREEKQYDALLVSDNEDFEDDDDDEDEFEDE